METIYTSVSIKITKSSAGFTGEMFVDNELKQTTLIGYKYQLFDNDVFKLMYNTDEKGSDKKVIERLWKMNSK